jgi:hypothetical protein
VRIDRPEPADEPDDVRMGRRAGSATDDPDAASKDQGTAVRSVGYVSTRASQDSALRIERAEAYRAAVDAAYRPYVIDHDRTRIEEPGGETVISAMRHIQAEDQERHLTGLQINLKGEGQPAEAAGLENPPVTDGTTATIKAGSALGEHDAHEGHGSSGMYRVAQLVDSSTQHILAETTSALVRERHPTGYRTTGIAADDMHTGARGPASRRDFDPEAAGGPVRHLDAAEARITDEGVQGVKSHLHRFAEGGPLQAPEQAMLDRLTSIAAGDMEPTSYDQNFYTHELDEAGRYAQLGFGPESGADLGTSEMYDVWNNVHTAALEDYGISDADLFHPGLAP